MSNPKMELPDSYSAFYETLRAQATNITKRPLVRVTNLETYQAAQQNCQVYLRHLSAVKKFLEPIADFVQTWRQWIKAQESTLTASTQVALDVQEKSMSDFLTAERRSKRQMHESIRQELEDFELTSPVPLPKPQYKTPGTRTVFEIQVVDLSNVDPEYLCTTVDVDKIIRLAETHGPTVAAAMVGQSAVIIDERVKPTRRVKS